MKKIFVVKPKNWIIAIIAAMTTFTSVKATAQQEGSDAFAYNDVRKAENTIIEDAEAKNKMIVHIQQEKENGLIFRVAIENPTEEKVTVYIKDGHNNILHRDVVSATSTFITRYNFQSLEDGQYQISVLKGKKKYRKEIQLKTRTQVQRTALVD